MVKSKSKKRNSFSKERIKSLSAKANQVKLHEPVNKLFWLIPLAILVYLLFANFYTPQPPAHYFYDFSAYDWEGTSYQNVTSGSFSFQVPIPEGSSTLSVAVRFKDNFPNSGFLVGARDGEDSHKFKVLFKSGDSSSVDWITRSVSFEVSELFIENNQANVAFNVRHLEHKAYSKHVVPLDWINVTVSKRWFDD